MITFEREEFFRRCEFHPGRDITSSYGRMVHYMSATATEAAASRWKLKAVLGAVWCRITAKGDHVVVEAIFDQPLEHLEAEQETLRLEHLVDVRQKALAAVEEVLTKIELSLDEEEFGRADELLKELSGAQHLWALTARECSQEGRQHMLWEVQESIHSKQLAVLERKQAERAEQHEQFMLKNRAQLALHGQQNGNCRAPRTMCRAGKTARDRASGAWKKRLVNQAARRSSKGNRGQKKGGKKGSKK